MNINNGEVWLAQFPFEDTDEIIIRPVIVLDVDNCLVLSVKVTKHEPRKADCYDIPIVYWQQAKLRFESCARISKTMLLKTCSFVHKLGDLHKEDLQNVMDKYMEFAIKNIIGT